MGGCLIERQDEGKTSVERKKRWRKGAEGAGCSKI
jgi:hypothetical protein